MASGQYHAVDDVERVIGAYIDSFVENNAAAKVVSDHLYSLGIGFAPIVDHITFRTTDVLKRAEEFEQLGFAWDNKVGEKGLIEFDDWWARVLRKPGFPALFIDQAHEGSRGKSSVIPQWVEAFTDKLVHHVAIRVEDIDGAIEHLGKSGIQFAGNIVGVQGSDLRQIFTKADVKDGKPFTVLELTERHHGYEGFLPPQAEGLMKSSTETE